MRKIVAGGARLAFGLQLVLFCLAWSSPARAQVGSPVYLTRAATIASGMITLTGPVTAVISGQPITVTQSGSVTVIQSGPLTLAQPVTVVFSSTPTDKILITDPVVNTAVANVSPFQTGGISQTISGNEGLMSWAIPGYYTGNNTMSALPVPPTSTIALSEQNRWAVDAYTRLRHGASSIVPWFDIGELTGSSVTGVGAIGLVDPVINTAVANVFVMPGTNAPTTLSGSNAIETGAALGSYSGGVFTQTRALDSSSAVVGASTTSSSPLVSNYLRLYGSSNNLYPWRQIDAVSNTQTALGVAAVGEPSYNFTPVTFVATGSVTYGPFTPQQSLGMVQITTTGTITAATVTIQGSNDGTNFAALGSTNFTLTSFSGTDLLNWNNLASIFIRVLVTITTLGGTNIITNSSVGHT